MPAYLHIAEPQEIRQEEERRKQLREEVEKCTLVKGTFRNKIYRFLADSGICVIYPLKILICLINQAFRSAFISLLFIPWTSLRASKQRDYLI